MTKSPTEMTKTDANKVLKHSARISETRKELKEATLAHQARFKEAKADGVQIDGLKLADVFERKDANEAQSLFYSFVQIAITRGDSWIVQGDMFAEGAIADIFKPEKPSEKALAGFRESQAQLIGYNEALGGGSVGNLQTLYIAGSAELVAAMKGWKEGTELSLKYATPGVKKTPSSGRGRRGKMAAAGDDDDEAETAESSGEHSTFDAPEEKAAAEADHPLSEPGDPPPAGPLKKEDLTQDRLAKMTNPELSATYAEITGTEPRRFESKAIAIAKIQGALTSRTPSMMN